MLTHPSSGEDRFPNSPGVGALSTVGEIMKRHFDLRSGQAGQAEIEDGGYSEVAIPALFLDLIQPIPILSGSQGCLFLPEGNICRW
jgi:hypothetical protein